MPIADRPLAVDRLEWEHINRMLLENSGNILVTAQMLSTHRKTLQRRLQKLAIKN